MAFVLGIDQGTTGSTAMLFDIERKEIIASENEEFRQIFPKSGWVEHNLIDIWTSIESVIEKALKKAKVNPRLIKSIGITNQRETTCAFDKQGNPLHNAIVWQDRRTFEFCETHKKDYESFQKKTGLPLDPYFSATKIHWLQNNAIKKIEDALFGTIDTFLLYKLTSGTSYYTEPTNASRTLLMDLRSCEWDQDLLNFFSIEKKSLPRIKNTFDDFGKTKGLTFLPDGIPITCLFGDQQSALFGQACYQEGDLKCTYGTGAFMLLNTGKNTVYSENGLLSTVAFKDKDGPVYALEGSTYIAGAAVQFLRDNLELIKHANEVEELASRANLEMMEDLFFFPFFTGIGSPYWNSQAKASIYGMTRDTNKSQIARACLEGICLSINDLLDALEKDLKKEIKEMRVDGGAVKNSLLMKIQANISRKKIIKPKIIETTVLGAILGSLVGLKEYKKKDISKFWEQEDEFSPSSLKYEGYYKNKQKKWTHYCKTLF